MPFMIDLVGMPVTANWMALLDIEANVFEKADGSWFVLLGRYLRKEKRFQWYDPPLPEVLALQLFPAYQALGKPYNPNSKF